MKNKFSLIIVIALGLINSASVFSQSTMFSKPGDTLTHQEISAPSEETEEKKEISEGKVYFRAVGNLNEWSLKISDSTIVFISMYSEDDLIIKHVDPIRAQDANVKTYKASDSTTSMNIQISQKECGEESATEKLSFAVKIEILKDNATTTFNGCGNYITDSRLTDIWVLEKLNGLAVSLTNFVREFPNLEIKASTNTFLGYTGCNTMTGVVFSEKDLLRFNNVITPRLTCFGENKEREFLKALQTSTAYKLENGKLILSNASGEKLVFKKVD